MSKGIAVMMHELCGDVGREQTDPMEKYYGVTIKEIQLENDQLQITFSDQRKIVMFDDGQSCCESRYMNTDDDLQSLVGNTLVRLSLKDAPDVEDEYGVHEVQFLEIMTNDGFVTISNHNEHNGYYGGFILTVKEVKDVAS